MRCAGLRGWWLAAGLGVMAGAAAARENVTVGWYRVPPAPGAPAEVDTLVANGWVCYLLVVTASPLSIAVGGWDPFTPNTPPGGNTSNNTGHDWGLFSGTGYFARCWKRDSGTGTLTPSNYGTAPTLVGTPADGFQGTVVSSAGSFFFTSSALHEATAPSEANNLANGTSPPYDRNPVPDGTFDTGVGTFMKAAGSLRFDGQSQQQVIAQVWVPGGSFLVARGAVVDGAAATLFNFDTSLFAIPEPGTLVMMGVCGIGLLKRSRREGSERVCRVAGGRI